MTHLYSLLPTDRNGLIVKDSESLLSLCESQARYNIIKSDKADQKYLYTVSIFKDFIKINNKPFYKVLFTIGQKDNIFKMITETFEVCQDGKDIVMFPINASLDLIFGPHEIDVFEYEADELGFLEKYSLFYLNKL